MASGSISGKPIPNSCVRNSSSLRNSIPLDTIGVDPNSGAIYVCSVVSPGACDIVKFDGYASGKELYRCAPPRPGNWATQPVHRIAVDTSAQPVRIWMPSWPYSPHNLFCIEDIGSKLVDKSDPRSQEPSAEGPRDITVSRSNGELYFKVGNQFWYRFDEKSGKIKDQLPLGTKYYELIPNNPNN